MPTIQIGNKTFHGKSNFDELSSEHLLYFCDLYSQKLTKTQILKRLAFKLTGAPATDYIKMNIIQRHEVENAYNWIFAEHFTIENKIKSFKIDGVEYYGYDNNFENIKVEEWMVADSAARKYQREKSVADLNKFIAALYRPHRTDGVKHGDPREIFDEYKCQAAEAAIEKLAPKYKYAILLNYAAIRSKMVKDFPNVFKGKAKGRDFGIPGMVHDMAGPELGTVHEIQKKWFIRNLLFIAEKNETRRIEQKISPE